jgi:hypothetical protein
MVSLPLYTFYTYSYFLVKKNLFTTIFTVFAVFTLGRNLGKNLWSLPMNGIIASPPLSPTSRKSFDRCSQGNSKCVPRDTNRTHLRTSSKSFHPPRTRTTTGSPQFLVETFWKHRKIMAITVNILITFFSLLITDQEVTPP